MRPLAIDLFCGLGGWTEGLLAEGWDVIGFDIERHEYGSHRYPGLLVIQDVLTLHGSQFKDAALIVASPPCQSYSYRAMPWKRAKALPPPDNALFDACFRIQREACEAAGRHIPLVVENVKGAQPWVGRARWNFGSFYLWGDVPAVMPIASRARKFNRDRIDHATENNGGSWFKIGSPGQKVTGQNPDGRLLHKRNGEVHTPHLTNPSEHTGRKQRGSGAAWFDDALNERRKAATAIKNGNDWFGSGANASLQRRHGSKSSSRKAASALIAKIPLPLSRHIARVYHP